MEYWKTLEGRPVEEDDEKRERSLIHIENLRIPYEYVMMENWEGVQEFFKENPERLFSKITMDGGTVFHLAASCSSKSQGKPLEKVINVLRGEPTIGDVRSALMIGNNAGNNTLHEVSMTGNKEVAMYLVSIAGKESYAQDLLETRNSSGETSLFKAAAYGFTDLVKFYVGELEKYDPDNLWKHFHRNDKTSILHIAVLAQHFETALWLVQNNPYLAPLKDDKGLTSLQLLAQMPVAFDPRFSKSKWKMLIYYCLPVGGDVVTPNQDDDVESSREDDVERSMDSNQPHRQSIFRNKLAGFVKVYSSLRDSLAKKIRGRIWKDKKNKKALAILVPVLARCDKSWCTIDATSNETISLGSEKKGHDDGGKKGQVAASDKTNGDDGGEEAAKSEKLNKDGDDGGKKGKAAASEWKKDARNSSPLLIATITGNLPIVKEILHRHPQAIEHVNDNECNILHLAIKYRQNAIFNLIQRIPHVMPKLSKRIDKMGNTILHQAADRSYYSISLSQKLIGPAMQLQDELRWMQRVNKIMPPHYTLHHTSNNQTAEELFTHWHDKLLEEAQKWVKEMAQSCSAVAITVATLAFAAAYANPGGTNGQNGLPLFQNDPLFLLFTWMDAVAIASSLSSVAFFLSVLTSPLEYPFFVDSIPRKVMVGFILLFFSMAATMLAFAASILLLIRVKKKWTMSILYAIAFLPVPLLGLLQFPVFQSFMVMLKKINGWFFKPLLAFLGFRGYRRPIWSASKPDQIT